jgi:hypothetical protein
LSSGIAIPELSVYECLVSSSDQVDAVSVTDRGGVLEQVLALIEAHGAVRPQFELGAQAALVVRDPDACDDFAERVVDGLRGVRLVEPVFDGVSDGLVVRGRLAGVGGPFGGERLGLAYCNTEAVALSVQR